MARTTAAPLPRLERHLQQLGERLRRARRRRGLPAALVAERAGMSLMTLRGVERGRAGTTIGAYLGVLHVLGLDGDIDAVAADDTLGRELQDANLKRRQRLKVKA